MDKIFQTYLQEGQMTISNLILHNYHSLGMDDSEFVLYLQIDSFIQKGEPFPAIEKIADKMGKSAAEVYQMLHRLIEKKLMEIKTISDEDGKKHDVYRFDLLLEKMLTKEQQREEVKFDAENKVSRDKVFSSIEVEFGRSLSPIELETINLWLGEDHYDPGLILLALREAVLNQAYSLKYIDRVLLSWERQHIKTAQDVQREKQKMRQRKQIDFSNNKQNQRRGDKPDIPLYHWSDSSQNGDDE
ncbi:chromosome replication initiation protein DnaD [Liquorilactobacillus sucicola DSM 21376 = JCM 15457]|nr:DnaD domain protein [Liquorilactobacillus sucicola]GAJ26131.1 chromosome replication initiation protein DnaD [Liquorilactobacillus sucicola DSM 21376 = JCM 15457]